MADDDLCRKLRELARFVRGRFGWVVRPRLELDPEGERVILDVRAKRKRRKVKEAAAEDKAGAPFSECRRDILALLLTAGRRLTGDDIRKGLEAAGAIHGESTVGHALAAMVKDGVLDNGRDGAGRGYNPV